MCSIFVVFKWRLMWEELIKEIAGENFTKFLQSYAIGLSPLRPDAIRCR